jgi:hypothetical protein
MRSRISVAALRVKRQRQDLGGIDAGFQEVDVALDQNPCLAGAGRRLERDVDTRTPPHECGRRESRASIRDSTVSGSASNGRRTSIGIDVVLPADRR